MARANLVNRRRSLQPLGQRLLAGGRPRQAEKLEERPAAEQVEIVRVGVALISEAIAALARALPSILDARQSAFVEGNRLGCRLSIADDAIVDEDQHDERAGRQEEPPEADGSRPTRCTQQGAAGKACEPGRAQSRIGTIERVVRSPTQLQSSAVLLSRSSGHGL